MVDYGYLNECPICSVADILARVRKTNAGPEVVIKGETNSLAGHQTIEESLPYLIEFLESSHPAKALEECNRTHSRVASARMRIYFDEMGDEHIALICQMLQVTKWSVPTLVNFGENSFSDAAVQSICGTFKFASPHLAIDLWDVKISDAGILHIRDALMQTPLTKGFRLVLHSDARHWDLNIRSKVQDSLIHAINKTILGNAVPNSQQISEAINGYNALHTLWPDVQFDTVNAKELLYQRYFQNKLLTIISRRDISAEAREELNALFIDFSDKTSELGFPQNYRWKTILNGFLEASATFPKKPINWSYVEKKLHLSHSVADNKSSASSVTTTLKNEHK